MQWFALVGDQPVTWQSCSIPESEKYVDKYHLQPQHAVHGRRAARSTCGAPRAAPDIFRARHRATGRCSARARYFKPPPSAGPRFFTVLVRLFSKQTKKSTRKNQKRKTENLTANAKGPLYEKTGGRKKKWALHWLTGGRPGAPLRIGSPIGTGSLTAQGLRSSQSARSAEFQHSVKMGLLWIRTRVRRYSFPSGRPLVHWGTSGRPLGG